ncbi:MAG TPA: hypothetical protein VGM01_00965 [Ktedonobacteraceae bacterium]
MQKIWEERFPFEWVDLRYVGNEQSPTPLAALQFQHQFLRWEMQGTFGGFSGIHFQRLTIFRQLLAKMDLRPSLEGTLPGAGGALVLSQMSQLGFTALGSHLYPVKLGGWHRAQTVLNCSACFS